MKLHFVKCCQISVALILSTQAGRVPSRFWTGVFLSPAWGLCQGLTVQPSVSKARAPPLSQPLLSPVYIMPTQSSDGSGTTMGTGLDVFLQPLAVKDGHSEILSCE